MDEAQSMFKSRITYTLFLLYVTLSLNNTVTLVPTGLQEGGLGHIFSNFILFILVGIPVLYMELTISQYTGRDCINMWKIRPCVSHLGYFCVILQFFLLVQNHVTTAYLLHYLLISFEGPPPYYTCGRWANKDCNIINLNYTLNLNCVNRQQFDTELCSNIHITYPEYQYFARHLLQIRNLHFFINPTILVPSAVITAIVFIIICRGLKSMKLFIYIHAVYPLLGYSIILLGGMMQKGVVDHFSTAIDSSFTIFSDWFSISDTLFYVLSSLGAGTGVISNISSLAPFRTPCYSNAVVAVLLSGTFTILTIVASAIMICPLIFVNGVKPDVWYGLQASFIFIKVPKMLSEFNHYLFYNLIMFSVQCCLGISFNVILLFSILKVLGRRIEFIRKYHILVVFFATFFLFLVTVPLIGNLTRNVVESKCKKLFYLVALFMMICESFVFMLTYGFDKFYEDIRFMQGIQSGSFVKYCFMAVPVILTYTFCIEIYQLVNSSRSFFETVGMYVFGFSLGMIVFIFFGKLLVAAFRRKFLDQFTLDPTWGPEDDILQRSRAMFMAHAMTKEYMYRTYHLQAGIFERQRMSNIRRPVHPLTVNNMQHGYFCQR